MPKAISLYQPWASLCLLPHPEKPDVPVKQYETRPWHLSYRGPLLIHAAKRFTREERAACHYSPLREALQERYGAAEALPTGALLGLVELAGCYPTSKVADDLDVYAAAMGNYNPGRWAWQIIRPRLFADPIPYRGLQGLFRVPLEVLPPQAQTLFLNANARYAPL